MLHELKLQLQGVYGAGAHTDYGVLTVLATDNNPGLQIYTEGQWSHVKPVPGTFVINLGDMLERCAAAHHAAMISANIFMLQSCIAPLEHVIQCDTVCAVLCIHDSWAHACLQYGTWSNAVLLASSMSSNAFLYSRAVHTGQTCS